MENREIKICLDAGHYGKYNQSPANPKYYESEAMWDLHLYLKKELELYGIKVITTREKQEEDLSLSRRGGMAKGCDFFISLHSNSVANGKLNEKVDYVVAFHFTSDEGVDLDERSVALAKKIVPVVAEIMGTKQKPEIMTQLSKSDKNKDGILNDNYYGVLNGARLAYVPGIIIEHSFHTNTKSTEWLMNDDNLRVLAKLEAKTIAEHFGIKNKKVTTMRRGMKGENIEELQKKLTDLGFYCEVDGSYGRKTEEQVKAFQMERGLEVDGVCGPKTQAELEAFIPYLARIIATKLNIRKGPGTKYDIVDTLSKGDAYTIVYQKGNWGKLKYGTGWISLKYTKKV